MQHVWQVIMHGVTDGRDSGYPTTTPVGPLFSTHKGAQDEADRLLGRIRLERNRTIEVLDLVDGRYSNTTTTKSVYEAVRVPVLSQAAADARQQVFIDEDQRRREARASELEAEVAALRA